MRYLILFFFSVTSSNAAGTCNALVEFAEASKSVEGLTRLYKNEGFSAAEAESKARDAFEKKSLAFNESKLPRNLSKSNQQKIIDTHEQLRVSNEKYANEVKSLSETHSEEALKQANTQARLLSENAEKTSANWRKEGGRRAYSDEVKRVAKYDEPNSLSGTRSESQTLVQNRSVASARPEAIHLHQNPHLGSPRLNRDLAEDTHWGRLKIKVFGTQSEKSALEARDGIRSLRARGINLSPEQAKFVQYHHEVPWSRFTSKNQINKVASTLQELEGTPQVARFKSALKELAKRGSTDDETIRIVSEYHLNSARGNAQAAKDVAKEVYQNLPVRQWAEVEKVTGIPANPEIRRPSGVREMGGQTEITASSTSAEVAPLAKEEVSLVRTGNDGIARKFPVATQLIKADELPPGHPLKKMIQRLEREGVRVVEVAGTRAEGALFDASYLGKSEIINSAGKSEVHEVIGLSKELLKDAESAKKMLGHESGHYKTHGSLAEDSLAAKEMRDQAVPFKTQRSPNRKTDFAKTNSESLSKDMPLPHDEGSSAYASEASGDEARQYGKQGIKELRAVKEAELQAKFRTAERLPVEEVFGVNSKDRLLRASQSFEQSFNFSRLESNSYQKLVNSLESKPSGVEKILQDFQADHAYRIEAHDKVSHFAKEIALDPKRYVGMPENADAVKVLQIEREHLLKEARQKAEIELKPSPSELQEPEIQAYLKEKSAEITDQKMRELHPWLRSFNETLKEDLISRGRQFEQSAEKMKEASRLVNKFRFQKNISREDYNQIRKSISSSISNIRSGATDHP